VIAQIIDYASSFGTLTDQDCVDLFGTDCKQTWPDCVAQMFPGDASPEELANVLRDRMQQGELNLVIACDKVPAGLPDVVSGIASQSTLGFDLDLVEVIPYVKEVNETAEILFVPTTRLETQIVSRTAVTVQYCEGDTQPTTQVQTTSLEDIEENLKGTRRVHPDARTWTAEETETEFRKNCPPVTVDLLEFVKQHSHGGEFMTSNKKQNAAFGFYVQGKYKGRTKRLAIFTCVACWDAIYIQLLSADPIATPETRASFHDRLRAIFGDAADVEKRQMPISLKLMAAHVDEFKELMLWFKEQVTE